MATTRETTTRPPRSQNWVVKWVLSLGPDAPTTPAIEIEPYLSLLELAPGAAEVVVLGYIDDWQMGRVTFTYEAGAEMAPADRAGGDLGGVVQLVTTIGSPLALGAALLFSFGWRRSEAQAEALGFDVSVLGMSPQDFMLRSIPVLFFPVALVLVASLGVVWVHARLMHRVERSPDTDGVLGIAYRGLRPLDHDDEKYFLIPDTWTREGARLIVLRDDGATRIEFSR